MTVNVQQPVASIGASIDEVPTWYGEFVRKLFKQQHPEYMKMHAAIGCAGEAGELADVIKREVIYERTVTSEGKTIREGIVEESGDLLFYLFATLQMYDIQLEEVVKYNMEKLGTRYVGLTYSNQAAGDRADKQGAQ